MKRCKHNWSKWTDPFAVEYTRDAGSIGKVCQAERRVQTRVCSECNRVDCRYVYEGAPKE
jgi:hypothetical protein